MGHPAEILRAEDFDELTAELQLWMRRARDNRIRFDLIRPLRISGTLELIPTTPLAGWWIDEIYTHLELPFGLAILNEDNDPLVRRIIRISDLEFSPQEFWADLSESNPTLNFSRWEIVRNSERHLPERSQMQLVIRLPRSQAEYVDNEMGRRIRFSYPAFITLIDPEQRSTAPVVLGFRKRRRQF